MLLFFIYFRHHRAQLFADGALALFSFVFILVMHKNTSSRDVMKLYVDLCWNIDLYR